MASPFEKFDDAVGAMAGKFFERPVANAICLAVGVRAVHMVGEALNRRESERRQREVAQAFRERAQTALEQETTLRNGEFLMEAAYDR